MLSTRNRSTLLLRVGRASMSAPTVLDRREGSLGFPSLRPLIQEEMHSQQTERWCYRKKNSERYSGSLKSPTKNRTKVEATIGIVPVADRRSFGSQGFRAS